MAWRAAQVIIGGRFGSYGDAVDGRKWSLAMMHADRVRFRELDLWIFTVNDGRKCENKLNMKVKN